MAPIQKFRCQGQDVPRREGIIEARFDKKSNKDVIRWEDIAQMFPGAMLVLKDDMLVGYECDSDMEELVPRRIAAYPDAVLEVIVSGQELGNHFRSHSDFNDTIALRQDSAQDSVEAFSTCNLAHQINHFSIIEPGQQGLAQRAPGSDSTKVVTGTNVSPSNSQSMTDTFQHTANLGLQVIVENQRHQADRIIDIMAGHQAELSAEIAKGNEKQDRIIKLQEEMRDMQEEMKDLQKQALDRLAIIQGRIQTVITQNYELLEYPIPRLFIILPRESRFRDRFNPFTVPFRLYFLCECGAHTMNDSTSSPHKIHIAKHEGYDIDQPTEFLEKYGPYILAILQMIKYGTAMATAVVPALAIADVPEQIKLASESIKHFKENFNDLIDDAISILQSKIEPTDPTYRDEGQSEFNGIEALEGADLRQLESYLKNKDSARTLGNLYRVVTNEGHVKWVCLDHYRENYKEVTRKQLREVVESNGGDFNENEGKISIDLESRILARQFYDALQRTRGIYDLDIGLLWDATMDDLRQLETTVRMCNISILKLGAQHFSGPASDVLNRGRRFSPLIGIMTNGNIRSFELGYCRDFFKRISRFPQGGSTSTLQSLILDNCEIRTTKDAVDLFNGLPSVKHIKIRESRAAITLSRTVDPSKSTEGRALDTRPSAKGFMLDSLMHDFDEWSNMNIVHFEADWYTISEYGIHLILSRNPQLETLTLVINKQLINPTIVKDMTRTIQQLCHPLKELTLDYRPHSSRTASLSFDHGRIKSATLQEPGCITTFFNGKSLRGINIRIANDCTSLQSHETQDSYYDMVGVFPVLVEAFPNLQLREVSCNDLDSFKSYVLLCEILAVSNGSLTKLTLASNSLDFIYHFKVAEMRKGLFSNITHFIYDYEGTAPNLKMMPTQDDVDWQRLVYWLSQFLPLKSSQQIRQQKMCVELTNIDMSHKPWGRFLSSIDLQSIHKFSLAGCTFSEETFSVLRTTFVDADLDLCIDGISKIGLDSKAASVAFLHHPNVRTKQDSK